MVVVPFVFFVSVFVVADCGTLRTLVAQGDYTEVGLNVGLTFTTEISDILSNYAYFTTMQTWLSGAGSSYLTSVKSEIETLAANAKLEMQGMADGSSQSYDDILCLNLAYEVRANLLSTDADFKWHTADYLFRAADSKEYYARQVDMDAQLLDKVYLLEAFYYDGALEEKVMALTIPGVLPGGLFSVNNNGSIFGFGDIYQTTSFYSTVMLPITIIARQALGLTKTDLIASTFIAATDADTAFTFQSFDYDDSVLYVGDYFVFPNGTEVTGSLTLDSTSYYMRMNKLQHITDDLTQHYDIPDRSTFRLSDFFSFLSASAIADKSAVLTYLGKTDNGVNGNYVDPATQTDGTSFTVLVINDISAGTTVLEVYKDNPADGIPTYTRSIRDFVITAAIGT